LQSKSLFLQINLPIEAPHDLRMHWDWSKVTAKLVASIAGKHEGWDVVNRSGHPALAIALNELNAKPGKDRDVVLECQGSSIGAYSTQWMNEFYCSARGESAKEWMDKPKPSRAKLPWPRIKIIFPSLQTVKNSILGPEVGRNLRSDRVCAHVIPLRVEEPFSAGRISGRRLNFHVNYFMTRKASEAVCLCIQRCYPLKCDANSSLTIWSDDPCAVQTEADSS
jgi:hypothetical protein